MSQATAWLLELGQDRRAAVGERELLHLLPQPQLLAVPLAPAYCARVLPWQDGLLPVWDVSAWAGGEAAAVDTELVAVVGYQRRAGQAPFFGALVLTEPPARVLVDDAQACDLPADFPWQDIASACFSHEERPVPILDLRRMFAAPLRASAA